MSKNKHECAQVLSGDGAKDCKQALVVHAHDPSRQRFAYTHPPVDMCLSCYGDWLRGLGAATVVAA